LQERGAVANQHTLFCEKKSRNILTEQFCAATIYLDTMLWNALCDQHIDPESFSAALHAEGGVLVFSEHTVYELAKTFTSGKSNAMERGRELMSYLQQYLDHLFCIKQPIELVAAEMWALKDGAANVEAFHGDVNFGVVRTEIDRLACGVMVDSAKDYIARRGNDVRGDRSGVIKHLDDKLLPPIRHYFGRQLGPSRASSV
jgi:hypothetical protein